MSLDATYSDISAFQTDTSSDSTNSRRPWADNKLVYRFSQLVGVKPKMAYLMLESGCKCCLCGEGLVAKKGHIPKQLHPTIEHVLPKFRGGSNRPHNLDSAHAICNHTKSSMTLEEWFASGLGRAPANLTQYTSLAITHAKIIAEYHAQKAQQLTRRLDA